MRETERERGMYNQFKNLYQDIIRQCVAGIITSDVQLNQS